MNRPPTSREVWLQCHAEYRFRLGLPCPVQFSEHVLTAEHRFDDFGTCMITINPTLEFERPEHLLLHEFAHHRNVAPLLLKEDYSLVDEGGFIQVDIEGLEKAERTCCVFGGHCDHWAQTLLEMYRETSTELPFCTMFESFAEAADIKYKVFERFNYKAWSK